MDPLLIKLSKTISTVSGELDNYRLVLNVTYAQGITDAIFVHQYFPGSPYAGATELSFYNVAYPDELQSIPVNPPNKSEACYVRTNRVDKFFKSIDDVESFMKVVMSDISRLLKYLETFDDLSESSSSCITITKDNNYEIPVDPADGPQLPITPPICACATSNQVELITESAGTIIVDITGK